jgi:hypothetical protein
VAGRVAPSTAVTYPSESKELNIRRATERRALPEMRIAEKSGRFALAGVLRVSAHSPSFPVDGLLYLQLAALGSKPLGARESGGLW